MLLDDCGEIGRLDILVYEDAQGCRASTAETALWKQGKCRLWLATYTFRIVFIAARDVDLSAVQIKWMEK